MKVLLLGDVYPTDISAPYFEEEDMEYLFNDALPLFEGNDITFVNLECAITEHDKAIKKFGSTLKAPLQTASVLKKLGVDYCGLSNNHVLDYGSKGIMDTMKALDSVGIKYTGFGANYEDSRKNLLVNKNGEKICFITVCEHEYSYALDNRMGSRPFDEYDTIEDIRKAKEENDRVIVIYHGGKEHCRYPSPRLHKLCHAMARNGADVILCQHSHCLGCYEQYENCHILYGQGNFHFIRENNHDGWKESLAVFYDTVSHQMNFVPLKQCGGGIERIKGEAFEEIMSAFEKRNKELLNGEWRNGWSAFCDSVKRNYVGVIANACNADSTEDNNGMISHYLDCEAHTDVWRELFPSYNLTNDIDE